MGKGIAGRVNYVSLRGVDLDNAIFKLQKRNDLSSELSTLLTKADVAYLQDREAEAAAIVQRVHDRLSGLDTDGDYLVIYELGIEPEDIDFPDLPKM